ncbi:hypothetical protein ElyMa_003266200 [Elysia marginata]|uniref:Uncharacterized protein n=1 Tax=Elysia marginata TaxID=1093978 RepID=A0AAV4J9Q3_9GAST|nr:hypothetical protein ElyMa_003266200 [Elysia marginata]
MSLSAYQCRAIFLTTFPFVSSKVNPYTVTVKNPYSTSRQETSSVSGIRKTLSSLPSDKRSAELRSQMQALQKMTLLPKKIKDAKMAGCKLPIDSTAASVLMFNTCQSQAAQLICQSEMMRCNTVGMAAMCCPLFSKLYKMLHNTAYMAAMCYPLFMDNLAMDTASYVTKVKNYVADML